MENLYKVKLIEATDIEILTERVERFIGPMLPEDIISISHAQTGNIGLRFSALVVHVADAETGS